MWCLDISPMNESMNPASRTQNPSKAKRIEDEITQIDDVNLVFLLDPRARALACSLFVHRQLRPAFDPSSRSPALLLGTCVLARSLARGPPCTGGERERGRDPNESLLVLCALSCFKDLYCSAFVSPL